MKKLKELYEKLGIAKMIAILVAVVGGAFAIYKIFAPREFIDDDDFIDMGDEDFAELGD